MFFYLMLCNQSRKSSDCTKEFLLSSATADFLVFFLKFRAVKKQIFPILFIQFLPSALFSELRLNFKQPRPIPPFQFLPSALLSKLRLFNKQAHPIIPIQFLPSALLSKLCG